MKVVKRFFNFINQQESTFLANVQDFQNSLSKYAITKDQHLGFEAAA
jgi:hypothetical protein